MPAQSRLLASSPSCNALSLGFWEAALSGLSYCFPQGLISRLKAPLPPVSLRVLVSAGWGTSVSPLPCTRLLAACPGHPSRFRCTNAAQLLTTTTIIASPLPPPPPNKGSLSAVTWRAPRRSAAWAETQAFPQLSISHSCSFPAMASQVSQNALLCLAALVFILLLSDLSKVRIRSHHFPA